MQIILSKNWDLQLSAPSPVPAEESDDEGFFVGRKTEVELIKNDILNAVSDYLINQKIPVPPPHPSNTCDPYTGSWSERLLTIAEYKLLYNRYGFKFEQYNGFYNSYENSIKSFLLKFINAISKIAGKKISAFIILVGFKKI